MSQVALIAIDICAFQQYKHCILGDNFCIRADAIKLNESEYVLDIFVNKISMSDNTITFNGKYQNYENESMNYKIREIVRDLMIRFIKLGYFIQNITVTFILDELNKFNILDINSVMYQQNLPIIPENSNSSSKQLITLKFRKKLKKSHTANSVIFNNEFTKNIKSLGRPASSIGFGIRKTQFLQNNDAKSGYGNRQDLRRIKTSQSIRLQNKTDLSSNMRIANRNIKLKKILSKTIRENQKYQFPIFTENMNKKHGIQNLIKTQRSDFINFQDSKNIVKLLQIHNLLDENFTEFLKYKQNIQYFDKFTDLPNKNFSMTLRSYFEKTDFPYKKSMFMPKPKTALQRSKSANKTHKELIKLHIEVNQILRKNCGAKTVEMLKNIL